MEASFALDAPSGGHFMETNFALDALSEGQGSAFGIRKGLSPLDPRQQKGGHMAIYHCSISNVSRSAGSASTATVSYITGERVYDERLGKTFYGFGREERIVMSKTLLPEGAPERYKDPSVLFNELELHEKSANARTAKKIEVALPREFSQEQRQSVIEDYIRKNITEKGYAATYAIHTDKDNNNPHAHILVANRAIENGEWVKIKTKKEYLLDKNGERVPLIDPKTGEQKVDNRNRKQWKRIDVEQNPLDRRETLKELRRSWAEICNEHLQPEQQIDHRSNADRGIEYEPTIHEGHAAREIEARGGVSERMQENREIRERNNALMMLKELIKNLADKISRLFTGKEAPEHESVRELLQRSKAVRKRVDERSEIGTEKANLDNGEIGERELGAPGAKQQPEESDPVKRADNQIAEQQNRKAEQERLRAAEIQRAEQERAAEAERRKREAKRIREEQQRSRSKARGWEGPDR